MRARLTGWVAGFLAVTLLTAAGCTDSGPLMGEVTGLVLVDGQPAKKGGITFIPVDGKSATAGAEIKDGRYTAKVPLGMAKVDIRVSKVVGKRKLYDTPDSPWQEELAEVLPAKYNDSTELRFEVKSGRNDKEWDLKSKGK